MFWFLIFDLWNLIFEIKIFDLHSNNWNKIIVELKVMISFLFTKKDSLLREAILLNEGKNWKKIAEYLNNRTHTQCLHRWQKVLNPGLVKGAWTKEEDDVLCQLVKQQGPKNWSSIATHLNGRIGKQCRERWYNHLDPAIRKDPWTPEEDRIICEQHAKLGNKWAEIAKLLVGR